MPSLVHVLTGCLLGGWLVLTALFQLPRLQRLLRVYDYLYLLPSWSFFAPVPATSDQVVFLRFEQRGEFTPWKQPRLIRARAIPLLWDPERRQRKTVIDVAHSVGDCAKASAIEEIHFATPYLMLLQFASRQPERMFSSGVQMMICAKPAGQPAYHLSFHSHVHALQPDPAGTEMGA